MNKYRAKVTPCAHGHTHASIKEAKRCNDLHMLQKAGVIHSLEVEPQYWFGTNGETIKHDNGRRVGYRPDFSYVENDKRKVEDVKGFHARDWPLRKAVFRFFYPDIELIEVRS